MLICDDFGRDIAKKYNFGKYSGTLSRKHLHEDLYYCVAIFKQETVTVHIPVENEHLFRFKMNADSGLRVHHFRTPQSTNSDVR